MDKFKNIPRVGECREKHCSVFNERCSRSAVGKCFTCRTCNFWSLSLELSQPGCSTASLTVGIQGGSVSSHSLISISCCLNVVVSSCKLHSLLHSDRTIWRMWNYHRSRDSRASTLVFEGWRASTLVIEVLWWSSIIVEMLNRRFFVVRIDIIWKRGLIMHKLCTLCNLCKLLHSYVIYAFYVTDCIIMQIMNIPCIFLHSGQN